MLAFHRQGIPVFDYGNNLRQVALDLMVAQPEPGQIGVPVEMRITITNPGRTAARDVVLHSVLPEGLLHRAGHELENVLGTIEAGQSRTLHLTVTPKQVGDLNAQLKLQAKGMNAVEKAVLIRATPALLSLSVLAPPKVEASSSTPSVTFFCVTAYCT